LTPEQFQLDLEDPRERHYVMAHYAFRQICLDDSYYFFSLMASEDKSQFIENLIEQVESNCPEDDTQLSVEDFEIVTSRVGDHPIVLIKMPDPKAYVEALYVGVVSTLDLTQPFEDQDPQVSYFTLELGEGDEGASFFFCEWKNDNHLNLGEIQGSCTLEAFATLVEQRMELADSQSLH